MNEFEKQFGKQARYLDYVKFLIGWLEVSITSLWVDMTEAADLELQSPNMRVAVRLREYRYYENPAYRDDFTIRKAVYNSGAATEYDKIKSGYGDRMLYGFMHKDDSNLTVPHWMWLDLSALRHYFNNEEEYRDVYWNDRLNKDGKTALRVYNIKSFDNPRVDLPVLLARSDNPLELPIWEQLNITV